MAFTLSLYIQILVYYFQNQILVFSNKICLNYIFSFLSKCFSTVILAIIKYKIIFCRLLCYFEVVAFSINIYLWKFIIFFLFRLDENDLMKKKQSCASPKKAEIFIANDYCDQAGIILSKNQSLTEDAHMREDNDRVS